MKKAKPLPISDCAAPLDRRGMIVRFFELTLVFATLVVLARCAYFVAWMLAG